jgi:hypothetical protein
MKIPLTSDRITLLLLILSATVLSALAYLSTGSYGGEDSFMHYLFARYAPIHPHLYLDHWAKPLFTLMASPFAWFGGFTGIRIFNILCGLMTAWSGYQIAKHAGWHFAWLAAPMILFNALFFVSMLSGLTEPLFACLLMISIHLYLKDKHVWASVILSFLPFVRSEGNLMFPLFILALSLDKKWKYIPLLACGSIFMSIGGGLLKGDYFWIITENPYQGAAHIYGSGSFFHFFRANREMLGVPQSILIVAGLMVWIYHLLQSSEMRKMQSLKIYVLVGGSCLIYILAHSWFWSQGIYGSFGLIRVMAAVVPLSSLIAVYGLQFVLQKTTGFRWVSGSLLALVMYFVVYDPFFQYRFPYPLDQNQDIMHLTANWYKHSDYKRVFTDHPYFCYAAGIDYFDPEQRLSAHRVFSESPKVGDILIWESHLAKNEGGVSEHQLSEAFSLQRIGILGRNEDFRAVLYTPIEGQTTENRQ